VLLRDTQHLCWEKHNICVERHATFVLRHTTFVLRDTRHFCCETHDTCVERHTTFVLKDTWHLCWETRHLCWETHDICFHIFFREREIARWWPCESCLYLLVWCSQAMRHGSWTETDHEHIGALFCTKVKNYKRATFHICVVISGISIVHRSAFQTAGCGPVGDRSFIPSGQRGYSKGPENLHQVFLLQPAVGLFCHCYSCDDKMWVYLQLFWKQ
jgi:hypothetical protein